MGGMLLADPEGLRGAGPHFDAIADSVAVTLRRLANTLDAEGPCWGADEAGSRFGSSYRPAADQARDAFRALHTGVSRVAAAVRQAADNADGADDRATTRLG